MTLSPQDKRLLVRAGKSRFSLQTLPAANCGPAGLDYECCYSYPESLQTLYVR